MLNQDYPISQSCISILKWYIVILHKNSFSVPEYLNRKYSWRWYN